MIQNITRGVRRLVTLDSDGDGTPDAKGAAITAGAVVAGAYALALAGVIKNRRIRSALPGIKPYRTSRTRTRYSRPYYRRNYRSNYRRRNYRGRSYYRR